MIRKLDSSVIEKIVENIGFQLIISAKTAPKARGINCLDMLLLSGDEKDNLSIVMDEIAEETSVDFFHRDADNIRKAQAVLLIACNDKVRGLQCRYCGFDCDSKPQKTPCVFNTIDLGIALGSAVSTAMQLKVDNRILFSAGKAAIKLQLFEKNMPIVLAIPLSISEKNIFFDRK